MGDSVEKISKSGKEKKSSKVNFSLGKKKKKKKDAAKVSGDASLPSGSLKESKKITFGGTDDNDEYTTTAEAANIETQRRKELGIELVIPLNPEGEDPKKNEPLLSGLKRIINGEKDEELKDKRAVGNANGNSNETSGADNKDEVNKEAEDALIQLATENQSDRQNYDSNTNFSSGGKSSLVIKQKELGTDVSQKNLSVSETMKYQRDLQHRAEDVSVDSKAYVNVPISEFGAAMLRGMGWKSQDNKNDEKKDKEFNPRPHRLGLGAAPLPPSMQKGEKGNNSSKRHWARKGGTMGDRAKIEKEEEEERKWKMKMEEKARNDIQVTLQVGSIVRVRNDENYDDLQAMRRARMIKIAGVPGLNRVLVRYEGESINVSVKKGDVILVSKSDLENDPFHEEEHNSSDKLSESDHDKRKSKRSRDTNEKVRKSQGQSRSRSRSRSREHKRDRKDRRHERSRSRERYKRHKSSRDAENDNDSTDRKSKRDRERSRDRKSHKRSDEKKDNKRRRENGYDSNSVRNGDDSRKLKKSKREDENSVQKSTEHWLTPNIRVRVVTKKIAKGRQYKQKGVVMDVLNQGTYAVVHMDNGELIERVPERYLETALPKVGGNAIILTGSNQFAKGKLLERNSSKGRGIIQLFEDMNVVTLGLDDIAEWCGSLDDEYLD
eukprot:CAMPEP_0203677074 /NCGR_PEP_ID=MMETSP0090-20130426/27007_1 /ASSEMBLY_ACC=CAM_ASM_001088 /TAXON_ID=426623 /ORGANISM="Chaetoceros affinis, Strain CCMP159" /LENGTH=663 /DNA_ID=CAMNT_0050543863 /DNA_START=49 /DNA_END=2040 /DNA_ORIENTATION=+